MLKKFVFLCACLMVGVGLASVASAQTVDEIIKRGELSVAIDLTNPPWGFLDAKQEPSGFDPDLAKLMADRMGVKLRIERVTSQSRIPYLQSGRTDMILATLSVTPERSRQVWFTMPYAPNPQILIAPKSKAYRSYADLKGARVAVPRGSPQDLLVTKMAPDAIMTRFDDDASALQALITGQADLLGGGMPIPAVLNKMDPGKNYEAKIVLSSLFMSMAVRKGDIDLLQFLNTQIFLLKQSGELDQISRKYFDVPIGDLPVF